MELCTIFQTKLRFTEVLKEGLKWALKKIKKRNISLLKNWNRHFLKDTCSYQMRLNQKLSNLPGNWVRNNFRGPDKNNHNDSYLYPKDNNTNADNKEHENRSNKHIQRKDYLNKSLKKVHKSYLHKKCCSNSHLQKKDCSSMYLDK